MLGAYSTCSVMNSMALGKKTHSLVHQSYLDHYRMVVPFIPIVPDGGVSHSERLMVAQLNLMWAIDVLNGSDDKKDHIPMGFSTCISTQVSSLGTTVSCE